MKKKSPRRFKTTTLTHGWSVSAVFGSNSEKLLLNLNVDSVAKIKEVAELLSTTESIVISEILFQQLDNIYLAVVPIKNTGIKRTQYTMPVDLKNKVKHLALDKGCRAYELVEACLLDFDKNKVLQALLGRFRALKEA